MDRNSAESEVEPSCARKLLRGIRAEFKCKNFGFSYHRPQDFYTTQWNIPYAIFVVYRTVLPVYYISWLVYYCVVASNNFALTNNVSCYLSFWCFLLLNCHLALAGVITVFHLWKKFHKFKQTRVINRSVAAKNIQGEFEDEMRDNIDIIEETDIEQTAENNDKMTWYMKLDWLLYSIISSFAPIVTIMYFAFIYPYIGRPFDAVDFHAHGVNTIIIIIEILFSALPIRILHCVYPIIYGLLYMTFSVIYWAVDHKHVLYADILDWNHPKMSGSVCVGVFAGIIVMNLLMFALYKIRQYMFLKNRASRMKTLSTINQTEQVESGLLQNTEEQFSI